MFKNGQHIVAFTLTKWETKGIVIEESETPIVTFINEDGYKQTAHESSVRLDWGLYVHKAYEQGKKFFNNLISGQHRHH